MDSMNTHNHGQPKALSNAEFEMALYATLRDEGHFFPCTPEEVASIKASIDVNGVPTPDAQKFREILYEATDNVLEFPEASKMSSQEVEKNLELLASAARNGGEITDEIRGCMDADRVNAKSQIQATESND